MYINDHVYIYIYIYIHIYIYKHIHLCLRSAGLAFPSWRSCRLLIPSTLDSRANDCAFLPLGSGHAQLLLQLRFQAGTHQFDFNGAIQISLN